jgi:hypothetical protein
MILRDVSVTLLLGLMLVGCGRASTELPLPSTIELPTSWVADGKTWTAQPAMGPADEELLTRFFHAQPQFQGSSDFEGSPKLMTAGKADRRFFWFHGTGDTVAWSCVHFEDSKFRTSTGTGNPFSK